MAEKNKNLAQVLILKKSCTVHLKPEGEICNRLKLGTKVDLVKNKGDWAFINWRKGKKRGWILLAEKVD